MNLKVIIQKWHEINLQSAWAILSRVEMAFKMIKHCLNIFSDDCPMIFAWFSHVCSIECVNAWSDVAMNRIRCLKTCQIHPYTFRKAGVTEAAAPSWRRCQTPCFCGWVRQMFKHQVSSIRNRYVQVPKSRTPHFKQGGLCWPWTQCRASRAVAIPSIRVPQRVGWCRGGLIG